MSTLPTEVSTHIFLNFILAVSACVVCKDVCIVTHMVVAHTDMGRPKVEMRNL